MRTASPQNFGGTLAASSSDLATSKRCQFFHLATPFCYGGVDTRTLVNNALFFKVGAKFRIIVFSFVVHSEYLNAGLKLCFHHVVEAFK